MTRLLVSFGVLFVLVAVTEAASIKYRVSSYDGDSYGKSTSSYKENSYKDDYKKNSYKDDYKKDSYKKHEYKDDYKHESYGDHKYEKYGDKYDHDYKYKK